MILNVLRLIQRFMDIYYRPTLLFVIAYLFLRGFSWFFIFVSIVLIFFYNSSRRFWADIPNVPRPSDRNNAIFFNRFKFGGHRGSPWAFPENSMSGFQAAKKEGADLIEFDVALTKDKIAVLLHDDDLDRTTNGKGPIWNKNFDELAGFKLASKFRRHDTAPYRGPVPLEGIPKLEEVIQWAKTNDMLMLFDVKDYSDEMVNQLVKLINQYNIKTSSIVCSFFPWVVYKIKRADPEILTGITWRQAFWSHSDLDRKLPRFQGFKQTVMEAFDFCYISVIHTFLPSLLDVQMVLANEKDISKTYVDENQAKGIKTAVWTVNDINQARWMIKHLHIPILTDVPYMMKKIKQIDDLERNDYNWPPTGDGYPTSPPQRL